MEKLKFNALIQNGGEILSREQMKNVMGGLVQPPSEPGKVCGTYPNCNSNPCSNNGTCGKTDANKTCTCASAGL